MSFPASCQTCLDPKCKGWSDKCAYTVVFVFYSTMPFQMFQVILLIMSLAKSTILPLTVVAEAFQLCRESVTFPVA